METFYQSAERPDNTDASEDARDMLEKLGSQTTIYNRLTAEIQLGGDSGAYGTDNHLPIAFLTLDVQ